MAHYSVNYIHKIAPSATDTGPSITLDGNAFSNRNTLGKALRAAGAMIKGARVASFRVEANKVIVFPRCPGLTTYWHSIILTAD